MVKSFPKLPKGFEGPAGPVTIHEVEQPRGNDESLSFGTWEAGTRRIEVGASYAPRQKWWTLFHESTHVALEDSGIDEVLTKEQMEAVCDAVATARLRERFG